MSMQHSGSGSGKTDPGLTGSSCSEACAVLNMVTDRKIMERKTRFYCSCRLARYFNRYESNQVTERVLDYFPLIQ